MPGMHLVHGLPHKPRLVYASVPGYSFASSPSPSWALDFSPENNSAQGREGHRSILPGLLVVERPPVYCSALTVDTTETHI